MAANQPLFFSGSLTEAIQLALTQNKLLGCFITDDSEASRAWEASCRTNTQVSALLSTRTVFLKLQSGSTEAGYLAAYAPIEAVPSIIFLRRGQVVRRINANEVTSLAQLHEAIIALYPDDASTSPATSSTTSTPIPSVSPASAPVTLNTPTTSTQIPVSSTPSPAPQSPQPKLDKGKGKATTTTPSEDAALTAKVLQKKFVPKADAEERARILALLENDKRERAMRKAKERAERLGETLPAEHSTTSSSKTVSKAKDCALLFRLLDGSSHKARFKPTDCLASIRKTLDPLVAATAETPGQTPPYTFKILLTPAPPHAVTISEEEKPLEDLGLMPSATLVLVPAKKWVESNQGGGGGWGLGSLVGGIVGTVGGAVGGVVNNVLGYHSVPGTDAGPHQGRSGEDRGGGSGEKKGDKNRSYYNGNGATYEGRDD
ncbi:hypothetical protein BJ508DRAFT_365240 [Ascobolus immersus RN42]|uniref:UBX domain-containing protein 2 n=1 Tax=Ascobolus immersus RN42 TaxID=1160509 RepID=A0A3N4HU47_ASCIM|nr:hypothetical protein BJ508DRAFT_365240 [Ascobolus immersus RN42]